jgi:uncharacterized protein Yka (UPF0111/DUF47 family)
MMSSRKRETFSRLTKFERGFRKIQSSNGSYKKSSIENISKLLQEFKAVEEVADLLKPKIM